MIESELRLRFKVSYSTRLDLFCEVIWEWILLRFSIDLVVDIQYIKWGTDSDKVKIQQKGIKMLEMDVEWMSWRLASDKNNNI